MKQISLWFSAIAIAAVLCAGAAFAAPMQVTIDKVVGTVDVKTSDTSGWAKASNGMKVPVGATIRTQAGGSCMVKWAGGNVAKLAPLSVLKVAAAEKTDGGAEKSLLSLESGKVFAHAKKLKTADSSFAVKTPTAVAGVRGTDLYGTSDDKGASTFGVVEGGLAVSNESGDEVAVDAGSQVGIDETGGLGDVIDIPAEILQEVKQETKEVSAEGKKDEAAAGGAGGESKSESKSETKSEEKSEESAGGDAPDTGSLMDNVLNSDSLNSTLEQAEDAVDDTGIVDLIIRLEEQN